MATLLDAAWEVAWGGATAGAERAGGQLLLSSRREAAETQASVVLQRQGEKSRSRLHLEGQTLLFSLLSGQGTHVTNFVLILVSVKCALGKLLYVTCLKAWDCPGEGSVWLERGQKQSEERRKEPCCTGRQ